MSAGLIIERNSNNRDVLITIEEWKQLIATHSDLRLRVDPYVTIDLQTGTHIQIPVGVADTEMRCSNEWIPFLRFRRGRLVTEFREEFKDPRNVLRLKIAEVAKQLGAVVTTDVNDEKLDW